jgi:hypothetical protein
MLLFKFIDDGLDMSIRAYGKMKIHPVFSENVQQCVAWKKKRRLIAVRQSVKRKAAPDKSLSLFADDPDIQGR